MASSPPLRYPLATLEQESDYLLVEIFEYERGGQLKNSQIQGIIDSGSGANKLIDNIILPVPNNLIDANGVSWGDSSMNAFQLEAIGGLSDAMSSNTLQGLASEGMQTLKDLGTMAGESQSAGQMLTSAIATQIVNSFGGQVTPADVLARKNGVVLNPNMELLFRGPNLRKFQFAFQMSPRSGAEAVGIKNIIRVMKQNMMPKKSGGDGNGIFLKTPNIFQLSFRQGGSDHPFLFNMKPMCLTNMSVNYTATGTYATYDAGEGIDPGVPVQLNMNLSFSELAPIYNEDYDDSSISGVGY